MRTILGLLCVPDRGPFTGEGDLITERGDRADDECRRLIGVFEI